MLLLLASLFFTQPAPLDMPRAEAYLVSEGQALRLEDRYDRLDLWTSQTVVGRWTDDEGRLFVLASLDFEPPSVGEHETLTREAAAAKRVAMKRIRANGRIPRAFRQAIGLLAPTALAEEKPRRARQLPRGFRDVDYWQHPTNYAAIVCAFRPEKCERWYLAYWQLAETDDYVERMSVFEDQFLRREFRPFLEAHPERPAPSVSSERELHRADARHSVAAYPNWHFSDSAEHAVLDDLPTRGFVEALTNELPRLRSGYAAAVPTPLDGSNVLAVVRLYASRDEYLDALETDGITNLLWSAAYWSPARRELVAHLPETGTEELMRTIRHEAFHQYLSYAASMIVVSPWLNEGYAQYFEDPEDRNWDVGVELTPETLEKFAGLLPGLLFMDYDQFYAGSDFERRLKYRLAWSVAVFLEKGAEKVRFRPFAKLKGDYFDELFRSRDMSRATSAAFRNADTLKLFVSEWKDFWKNR